MAAEFGLTCITAHKMDATQALQLPGAPAAATSGPIPPSEVASVPEHADNPQTSSPAGGGAAWRGQDPRAAAEVDHWSASRDIGGAADDLGEAPAEDCSGAADTLGVAAYGLGGGADELGGAAGCTSGAAAGLGGAATAK